MARAKGDVAKILGKFGSEFGQDDLMQNATLNAVSELLNQYGDQITNQLRFNLKDRNKNASYSLYQSIEALPIREENKQAILEIVQEEHWKYADAGRKPGKMPPKGVIEKWIKNKPSAIQRMRNSGVKGKLSMKSIAFLIGRKIAAKGIKPSNYFSDVVNTDLTRAIEEDLIALTSEALTINLTTYNGNNS